MPTSRRGSGSVTLPSGQVLAIHTRTHDDEDLPHATKKCVPPPLPHPAMIIGMRYERLLLAEPWPIISGNTRACALAVSCWGTKFRSHSSAHADDRRCFQGYPRARPRKAKAGRGTFLRSYCTVLCSVLGSQTPIGTGEWVIPLHETWPPFYAGPSLSHPSRDV